MVLDDEEDEPEVTVSEVEAHNRDMTLDELRAEKGLPEERPYVPTLYHRRLAMFVAARLEEVQFAERWHKLPGDIPINEQPWWKTRIWHPYLVGESEGRRQAQ